MPKDPKRSGFSMTIGADSGAVAGVNAALAGFAAEQGLPAAVRRSLHVALDELLHNTIAHGFEGRPDGGGEVTVEVELRPDRVCVTLSDDGPPFDPFARAAPDTSLSVDERQIGGLGIHLVRQMMDDVRYQRLADRNVVVLEKHLAGARAPAHRGGRSMEISTRTEGGVTIVAFAGNMDSKTAPEAQQAIDGILAEGGRKMVVDFTALDYISSAGLRVLLGAAKKLSGGGGGLRLFGLNETVREVFTISGFSTILSVCATEADALRGL